MNRGDVVLVDWRFSDGSGSKLRPAIVVQADYLNGLLEDTVLVQITSKAHGIPGTEIRLDPSVERASGLLHVSYAFCPNILTIDPESVDQVIGSISDASMKQIEACLKSTLGIP